MNVENDLITPILPFICRSAKNRRIGSNATIFSLSDQGSWPANVADPVTDRQTSSNRGGGGTLSSLLNPPNSRQTLDATPEIRGLCS
jgi:hypothetical protein